MKSVGEAMAIGRSFEESMQKALRSLETGLSGFDPIVIPGLTGGAGDRDVLRAALGRPTPDRILVVAEALRRGLPVADVHAACKIDPWFLERILSIVQAEHAVQADGLPDDAQGIARLKRMGFSDTRLGVLAGTDEASVAERRRALGCSRSSSASTPARPSSRPPRPTCTRPTRATASPRPSASPSRPSGARW